MNDTKDENGSNRSLIVRQDDVNTGIHVLNLLDEKQLANAEVFLKKIIATEKGGVKSVNEGLAVLMRAQDSRAGIVWETTKDYVPQYKYTDGNNVYDETLLPQYCVKCRTKAEAESKTDDEIVGVYPLKYYKDLKGRVYNEFQINEQCIKCINLPQAMKVAQEGKFPVIRTQATPTDYVTEYEFTRFKRIYGKIVETHAVGHFSYTEANTADLFTKDTFKKYTRIMIGHRAFMYGARDIASDILMGVMSDDELSEVFVNSVPDDEDFVNVEEISNDEVSQE